jgi:hypothetical protein
MDTIDVVRFVIKITSATSLRIFCTSAGRESQVCLLTVIALKGTTLKLASR